MPPESPKADALNRRLAEGDENALAELFDMHRQRLWRIVQFRMHPALRQRLEPDDVLQEAYLAAAKRLSHFASGGFKSGFLWMRLVVNQTLVDLHRRHLGAQARDVRCEVAVDGLRYPQATSASLAFQLADSATSPSQVVSRHELLEKVAQAVNHLSPMDQEILALRHFEELTNGESAAVLDIEPKAASIRYVRALRRLKAELSPLSGFFTEI